MNLKSTSSVHRAFQCFFLISLLAFWPMSYLGFTSPKLFLLNALVALVIFFRWEAISQVLSRIKLKSWSGLTLAFFALTGLYTLFSWSPWGSLLGLSSVGLGFLDYLLFLAVFLLALTFKKTEEKKMIQVLLWVNLLSVIYALLQVLSLDPFAAIWNMDSLEGRVFSFFGNPNWFAGVLILTGPVVIHSLMSQKKRITYLLLSGNLIALLFTGSKSAWIALIAMGLLYLFLQIKSHKTKIRLLCAGGLFSLAGIVVLMQVHGDLSSITRSLSARWVIWGDTIMALKGNIWGHGLDTFHSIYPQYLSPELWEYESFSAHIESPHQHGLQLLFEMGPLGLITYYFLAAGVLWKSLSSKINSHFYMGLSLVGYLLMLQFGFETPVTALIFWLFVGLLLKDDLTKKKVKQTAWVLVPLILSVVLITSSVMHFKEEKGAHYFSNGDEQTATEVYPYNRVFELSFAEQILLEASPSEEALILAHGALVQVNLLTNGLDQHLNAARALLFFHQGNYEAMELEFQKALEVNPNEASTHVFAIQLYDSLGNEEKADLHRSILFDLLPSFWNKADTNEGRIFQKNHPWVLEWFEEEV